MLDSAPYVDLKLRFFLYRKHTLIKNYPSVLPFLRPLFLIQSVILGSIEVLPPVVLQCHDN